MSKNKQPMPEPTPTSDGLKSLLGTDAPATKPTEATMAEALAVLAEPTNEADAVAREKAEKAERIATVHAKIKAAQEDLMQKSRVLDEVTKQVEQAKGEVTALNYQLEKLTAISDEEANREYFAEQLRDRERRAAVYHDALAKGLLTPGGVLAMGVGVSPCDQAIAQRNRTNGTLYLANRGKQA